MRRGALRLALGAAFGLALSGPVLAEPPIWTIHSKSCDVTLFGSMHILPEGLDWEPQALKTALASAQELWFEIPLDPASQAEVAALARVRAFLPTGDSLAAHLSKAGQARLKASTASLHLPDDVVNRSQPWFAELTVASAAFLRDGGRADQGVEQQLEAGAPQAERKAFETGAQQIAMFADTPMADQIASLEDTLKEIDTDPGAYKRLLAAWLKADDQAIYRHDILTMKRDAPAQFEILITRRNAAWTRTLAEKLKGSCQAVVVVGVGHLLGPDGVPNKLRALGFKVSGPKL